MLNASKFYAAIYPNLTATLLLLIFPTSATLAQEFVTITPEETDAILQNPGMGWETFHHSRTEDSHLPSWIPSTVQYARWGWGVLEPEQGHIDYDFLDSELKKSREAGQALAFRVMCHSTTPGRPYHPTWLSNIENSVISTRYGNGPLLQVPALDNAAVLDAHLDFIGRLGARYDGHPDIAHIDLGSVGWWGEWHMSRSSDAPMPTPETQKKIVDAYLAAFEKTPLVMLIGGGDMLTYAVQHGTGWRADCLGDMGGFSKSWCHMRMAYPERLPAAGAMDAWKQAPVAWETCWDMRKWVDEGWSLRFILNYALALHGSVINNKSAPLPEGQEVRAEIERFLRRLGYRIVLRQFQHPTSAQSGESVTFTTTWQNVGSAPCYQPYRIAYRLSNDQGYGEVLVGRITVDQWLPGSIELFTEDFFQQPADLPPGEIHTAEESVNIPADTPDGTYELSIGVIGIETQQPVVRLGIDGRDAAGWYPLSTIKISAP